MTGRDGRNWKIYNEQLVQRGELLLDFDFVEKWDTYIGIINENKFGRPYHYPEQYIAFLGGIKMAFHLPYRELEGVSRKLGKILNIPSSDWSTTHRRLNQIKVEIDPEDKDDKDEEDIIVAVDSSGIKVTNRGDWLRKKWGKEKKKGFIKIHLAVDVKKKKILAMEVSKEDVSDSRKFKKLIKRSIGRKKKGKKGRVKKVLADGAYDTRKNFNLLEEMGIEPGIKVRKNASRKARGFPARKKAVLEFQDLGYESWKEKKHYGQRWAVEGIYSSFKRTFGEYVMSKKYCYAKKELLFKMRILNSFISLKPIY
ncbi:MAG: IS5 family transposase [Candidatus Thermoplasmatota archaeon]|nr:IS5 family transposase [Candidatus Thermoplasmatota archaeon]